MMIPRLIFSIFGSPIVCFKKFFKIFLEEPSRREKTITNLKLKLNSILPKKLTQIISFGILFLLCPSQEAYSSDKKGLSEEQLKILKMDIKELMQTEAVVTSPSKRPQLLHQTASAVYVITQEDIRRTGAVNIMEALRIVPGVQVSKINQNRYAVSIRGFNSRLGSDKLLVLIDGRTIYSPSAAGVFWIGQDTVLEDVDRIEVIRGPGASLWGSNAVAGVINIITKESTVTQGTLLSGGVGTEERGFGTLRYGGKAGDKLTYRVYGKYRDRGDGQKTDGSDAFDDKQIAQGGFRSELQVNSKDTLTLQGDYYHMEADLDFKARFVSLSAGSAPFKGQTLQKGANFLSRWNRKIDAKSSMKLQMYYDRLERRSALPFKNNVDQVDVEFQHNMPLGTRQFLTWGLNYRYAYFDFETTDIASLPNEGTNLYGFFVHDEINLIPNKWNVILGSKFEHNEFSGLEIQPNIRTAWTPNKRSTYWAAVSRAVRIPTIRDERAVANRSLVPGAPPLLITETNDGRTNAEELIAYEIGYRFKPKPEFQFDITGYIFDYENIIEATFDPIFFTATPAPAHLVLNSVNDNALEGEVFGIELSGQWQPSRNWRLSGSYTFLNVELRPEEDSFSITTSGDLEAEGEPEHVINLRSYLNLPYDLELDTMFYYVSRNSSRQIRSYQRVDMRLGWKPTKSVELSLTGQNLFDESHPELSELLEEQSETERSFYAKATFKF